MKLASDNETLAENKALILYILNKVNKPIENTAFYKLILTFEDMNYFYFQQFLLDLMDNKYILKGVTDKNETVYEMTADGRQAISLVQDLIPGFTRFQIDNKKICVLLKMNILLQQILSLKVKMRTLLFVKLLRMAVLLLKLRLLQAQENTLNQLLIIGRRMLLSYIQRC